MNKRQGIRDFPKLCLLHGIDTIVVTPGSRNVPLIESFLYEKGIQCISLNDERSAAYFALGISQYRQKPACIITTSGTAVLNCAPALAEAFYQNIPLICITADRPHEWIDQYDNQAIKQKNVFGNFIKGSFELPVETITEDDLWYNNRTIAQAIELAKKNPAGPVHINVPLREPLYNTLPENNSNPVSFNVDGCQFCLEQHILYKYLQAWKTASQKILLCGISNKDEELIHFVNKLSEDSSLLVFAENLSNITGDKIINSPDRFIASLNKKQKEDIQPVILITVGHSIISKKVKQFLREYSPKLHWHIDEAGQCIDTFKNLTDVIPVSPSYFLDQLSSNTIILKNDYRDNTLKLYTKNSDTHTAFLAKTEYSDLKVFESLLNELPEESVLHLGNSTPVRYAQFFPARSDIVYFSNRGTSGIDGCLSTAAGSALSSKKITILITGDVSFVYDSNALWNSNLPENLKVIVINNNGGNIFRLIASENQREEINSYIETPHKVNIKSLAEAFHVKYFMCDKLDLLKSKIQEFYGTKGVSLLEIKTDPEINTKVYKSYLDFLTQSF